MLIERDWLDQVERVLFLRGKMQFHKQPKQAAITDRNNSQFAKMVSGENGC
jgi:uncharacterized protein YueI